MKVAERRLLRAVSALSAGHAEPSARKIQDIGKIAGWKPASRPSPAASALFVFHHILLKKVLLRKKAVSLSLMVKKKAFSLKNKMQATENWQYFHKV